MTIKKIAPNLDTLSKGIILDVRTHVEHKEHALSLPHLHIPLDELNVDVFLKKHPVQPDQPLYILCRSGKRACQAAEAFMTAGIDNVHVIDGGILACSDHKIPTCKQNVISLERQVRITAGLLVFTGTMLGHFINGAFYVLPAFIGAGLVFTGIIDWCGMGLLLAKAPWNQRCNPSS